MSKDIYVFFELLKAGLWRDQGAVSCLKFQVPSDIDWERVSVRILDKGWF
jgi:hypothetical protein